MYSKGVRNSPCTPPHQEKKEKCAVSSEEKLQSSRETQSNHRGCLCAATLNYSLSHHSFPSIRFCSHRHQTAAATDQSEERQAEGYHVILKYGKLCFCLVEFSSKLCSGVKADGRAPLCRRDGAAADR